MPVWFSGVVLALLAGAVTMGIGTLYSLGSADLAAQDMQPIRFSHRFHAGTLKINCQFCHRYVTQSPVAGVPSLALCQTCHASLGPTTSDLKKLQTYWKQDQPIPWVRLQRLPDHVYFTHEMHLLAGLSCTSCHGNVERMSSTPRAPTYEMGWCLTCHRQRGASQDCWTCHQ